MIKVAVLGASDSPVRTSFMALMRLEQSGYEVLPINPRLENIMKHKCYKSVKDLPEKPHTLSIYLAPEKQKEIQQDILSCGAERVIFNPGAENPELKDSLKKNGIEAIDDCTLVLLRQGRF